MNTATVVAGSTVVLLARIRATDASYVKQSYVTSIRVDVYQFGAPTTSTACSTDRSASGEYSRWVNGSTPTEADARTPVDPSGTVVTDGTPYLVPTVSDSVFDTLQTDPRWTADSTGYNLAVKLAVPDPDTEYEVRVTLHMVNGDTLVVLYKLDSQ